MSSEGLTRSLATIGALVALEIPWSVFAHTEPDTLRTYSTDPVTVTGTRLEVLRSSVPNAVSVITSRDLQESGASNVLSLVARKVPGVFVTERGVLGYGLGPGAAGGITIRGSGGSPNTQVLVLTDGRPHMMGLFGHPFPDMYVTSNVDRVEILRGPASLLHGTNAMGGVINIITRRGNGNRLSLDGAASAGTFQTRKFETTARYSNSAVDMALSGNWYTTNGHRPYSSFDVKNGAFRIGYELSSTYFLSGDLQLSKFKTFDPGPAKTPYVDHWVDILRGSSGLSLENRHAQLQGALKVFYNFGRHKIYDGFRSTDGHVGALLYESFSMGPGTNITVGADYKRYGGSAENILAMADFGNHHLEEQGAYILLQQKGLESVTTTAGLRLNRHSLCGSEVIPQVGIAWRVIELSVIKASVSRGFRSPTIRELFLFPAPTPTLSAERMWNYEVGFLQQLGEGSSIEVNAFLAEGSNQIRTVGNFPNLSLSNSGWFTHRGVELSGTAEVDREVRLDGAYTFLEPGEQTAGNPSHNLYVGASFSPDPLELSIGFQFVSELYGGDYSRNQLPDYGILNARAAWTAAPFMVLYAAGENLFDRSYQTLFDYPMPGVILTFGIEWKLQ